MSPLSDKELDQLSQKAAEQYDPGLEHNPGAWEKLDQQLTRDLGRTGPSLFRGYRRIPFLYAPIVVLLVGVSYFLFKQGARQHSSASKQSDTASLAGPANSSPPGPVVRALPPAAKPDQSPKIEIPGNNSTTKKETTASLVTAPTATTPAVAPTSSAVPPASSLARITAKAHDRPLSGTPHVDAPSHRAEAPGPDARYHRPHRNTTNPGNGYKKQAGSDPLANSDRSPNSGLSDNDQTVDNHTNIRPAAGQPGLPYSTITASPSLSHTRPVIYDSALRVLAAEIAARKTPPAAATKKKSPSLHVTSPLQIGLLFGPDFTTVKSVEGTKPGHSLGLTLGYQLFGGWSVNTGLLWTRKNYTAPAKDFHPPVGSWFSNNNMIQLHFVQGSMDMLEIPLNIRYDFKMPDNTIFYLSTGLSSYLVGNENCLYFYENFGMNRRAPEKQDDRQSYWFAALNLAFGIEKPISKTLSLQGEPYLKLPLNGVGIGNVQLNSFGINFSLKYTPVLKKSKH